jgi:uncharacterized membrane protein (DUF4010 family)
VNQESLPDLPWLEFALALAIGGLVGVEREHKKRQDEVGTGLRTFVLVAEAGAIAAWLSRALATPWIFIGIGALVAALTLAGYVVETRAKPEELGKTTEAAMLVVYLLGGTAVFGYPELAVALAITTSAALAFKEPLHGFVDRIGRHELQAALKLLIATFIVLPVLPNRTVDPWGALNPWVLWWLVILICALSFAGYVASRWLGPERGLPVAGFFGGMVSSTAVTLSFARRSRESPAAVDALAAGIILSWGVMVVRIAILVAVVDAALLAHLWLPLAILAVAHVPVAVWLVRRSRGARLSDGFQMQNPFSLAFATRFALLFAAIRVVVELVRTYLPGAGLYLVAAVAGLPNVDAITLSMAEYAQKGEVRVAVGSIVIAAMSNTLLKCVLVATAGSKEMRARVWTAGGVVLAGGVAAFVVAMLAA